MSAPIPGEVALADLNPAVANEQGGVRPVLVISRESYNRLPIDHVIIVPITRTDRGIPFHVPIGPEAGLRADSFAMANSVRAISLRRLGATLGHADAEILHEVREHVLRFLRD